MYKILYDTQLEKIVVPPTQKADLKPRVYTEILITCQEIHPDLKPLQYEYGPVITLENQDCIMTWTAAWLPLEQAKSLRLTEIIQKSDEIIKLAEARYAIVEIRTFDQQQREAKLIVAGETDPAKFPLLATLVAGENTAKPADNQTSYQQFAERVLANVGQANALKDAIGYQLRGFETAVKEIVADQTLSDEARVERLSNLNIEYVLE